MVTIFARLPVTSKVRVIPAAHGVVIYDGELAKLINTRDDVKEVTNAHRRWSHDRWLQCDIKTDDALGGISVMEEIKRY